jgi:glycosyltransferase involved in cell wall biosynthesis
MAYKVLFVSDVSRAPFTSIADRMLVRGLYARGVEMTVITPRRTAETKELEELGISVLYLPIEKKISRTVIKRLKTILDEGNFELMHITFSKAMTNCLLASRGRNIRIVGYYGSLSLYWHDPSAWLAFLNPRIDTIICASRAVEQHVKRQLPRRRRERTVQIYRGYDPAWFSDIVPVTREEMGVAPGEFLICSVGNLRRVKGIRYLIEAARYLPTDIPYRILLIGDGTDTPEIIRMAHESGHPDRFIHQGHVSLSPAWVAPCDLYVQPSLSEGLGRAISEAMCLAKPVIVTDGGGAKEFFAEGDNGFVVKRGSAKALAEEIIRCWNNKESLSLTGLKARESMMNRFNHRLTVEFTYRIYCNLLG